jgi:hypothetical protein
MAGEINRSEASLPEVLGALKNYADAQQTTDEALITATELYTV